jgi:anti-anti-sigma factor
MDVQLNGERVKLNLDMGLTANHVVDLNEQVERLLPEDHKFRELIFDLCNTENIDSVGVTFVISLYKAMKSKKKSFRIVGANDDVQSLFKLMKLDQFFEIDY